MADESEEAEIFRQIVIQRQRRALDYEQLRPEIRRSYDLIKLRARDLIGSAQADVAGLPPIYFDFVVDPQVNAFATRKEGRYFIGLNTGLVFLLRLLITRMLADPTLFPRVGDPSVEATDLPQIERYF